MSASQGQQGLSVIAAAVPKFDGHDYTVMLQQSTRRDPRNCHTPGQVTQQEASHETPNLLWRVGRCLQSAHKLAQEILAKPFFTRCEYQSWRHSSQGTSETPTDSRTGIIVALRGGPLRYYAWWWELTSYKCLLRLRPISRDQRASGTPLDLGRP